MVKAIDELDGASFHAHHTLPLKKNFSQSFKEKFHPTR